PTQSPLFPYTTLFRSKLTQAGFAYRQIRGNADRGMSVTAALAYREFPHPSSFGIPHIDSRDVRSRRRLRRKLVKKSIERRLGTLDRKSTRLNSSHVSI